LSDRGPSRTDTLFTGAITKRRDHIVNPMDIEGIEVYTHAAEAPVEYRGPGTSCGAILLWTRGF